MHTVNDQLQGTAVDRAAVIGSDSEIQKSDRLLAHGSKLGRARGQRVVIGGVALKSLNMYGNVAFVRHKIACCVARSHATFHRLHAHRSVSGYSPGKVSRRPHGAVLRVSRFKCGPERANSWPHCLTLS